MVMRDGWIGWLVRRAVVVLALVGAALVATPLTAAAAGPEVRVSDTVFVVPDKNAKAITGWLTIRAGCADEAYSDCRGLAHYVEHLLFINRDSENRSKVSMFPGGNGNGWTNLKSTTYFQRFPADPVVDEANLDKLIGYFAGLLTDIKADVAQADRERNVVLQEYQANTGRNAYARFAIKLNAKLLPDEALGQRTIGSPETIAEFTLAAARDFHRHWYAKNNSVLILHGPIDPDLVARLTAKHFNPLPVKALPPHTYTTARRYEPKLETLDATDKDAKRTRVYVDKIVTFEEPQSVDERRVLTSARSIISQFLSSRLENSPYDQFIEKKGLLLEGGISLSLVRRGALRVSFWGDPAPGIAVETVVDAAKTYITALETLEFNGVLIERLKSRIANSFDLMRQQPEQYANSLMRSFEAHNSYDTWLAAEQNYAAVSTDQVRQMLKVLSRPGRQLVSTIRPEPAAAVSQPAAGTPPDTTAGAAPGATAAPAPAAKP
jgi:zinc protease